MTEWKIHGANLRCHFPRGGCFLAILWWLFNQRKQKSKWYLNRLIVDRLWMVTEKRSWPKSAARSTRVRFEKHFHFLCADSNRVGELYYVCLMLCLQLMLAYMVDAKEIPPSEAKHQNYFWFCTLTTQHDMCIYIASIDQAWSIINIFSTNTSKTRGHNYCGCNCGYNSMKGRIDTICKNSSASVIEEMERKMAEEVWWPTRGQRQLHFVIIWPVFLSPINILEIRTPPPPTKIALFSRLLLTPGPHLTLNILTYINHCPILHFCLTLMMKMMCEC